MSRFRFRLVPYLCCVLLLASSLGVVQADSTPAVIPPGPTPDEVKVGDKAAIELEKDPKTKLLNPNKDADSKALLDKLNTMVKDLGAVSARPLINYQVKVIESKDVNSFTLPNGHIYMYRGLLDLAGSDDEIAAVLGHEIGHNARMHYLRGEKQEKKMTIPSLIALGAMLVGGGAASAGLFSQYLMMGVINIYSIGYEKEADAASIQEMVACKKYNPSAMVTFMQRLEREEKQHPEIQMGIFEDHPLSDERVAAALTELQDMGVPFTPRDVHGAPQSFAKDDKDRSSVRLGDLTLLEFATSAPGPGSSSDQETASQRAGDAATALNQLLNSGLAMHEISVDGDASGARLLGRDQVIARFTPADAKLYNLTPLAFAQKWRDSLRRMFWREQINGKL